VLIITSCQKATEGFPLFGVRINMTPEQIDIFMKRAGFKMTEEQNNNRYLILHFSKKNYQASFIFDNKKLSDYTLVINNGNFETLLHEIRAGFGYPSYYSKIGEKVDWSLDENSVINRITMARDKEGHLNINLKRDTNTHSHWHF